MSIKRTDDGQRHFGLSTVTLHFSRIIKFNQLVCVPNLQSRCDLSREPSLTAHKDAIL